jgi:REP element-mobilizing transposase RayT
MTHRRPPRLTDFDYLGPHRYFVTCCTLDRHEAFVRDEPALAVRSEILRTSTACDFEEIALVLMPDHVHALFEGRTDAAAFIPFMTLLRQRAAVAYRRLVRRPLWQDGYHEHVLRDEERTRTVAAYIIGNPIRKQLVARVDEYPYVWCKYGLEIA